MSSGGDVLCFCRSLLRASPTVFLRGQTVPERVGSGDPGRAVRCGGDRQRAGLRTGPTGRHQRPAAICVNESKINCVLAVSVFGKK